MNYRLKSFVSVQRIKSALSISGCVGGDIIVDYNDDNISLLRFLMSEDGICSANYSNNILFQKLKNNDLLEDVNAPSVARNESFFQYVKCDFAFIINKRILILGAGAAGGTISYLLAQQGFRRIATVDYDRVENSDVEKTMVYDASDVGLYKIEALSRRIQSNFGIEITQIMEKLSTIDDAAHIINDYAPDMIVYAIDPNPAFKLNLDKLCLHLSIPIIHAAYSYEKILCGPCVVPHRTACVIGYNEYLRKRTNDTFDFYDVSRILVKRMIHPSISFNINVLANIILKDIIFCLGERYDNVSTFNNILTINLLTLETSIYELSCKFCKSCEAKSEH